MGKRIDLAKLADEDFDEPDTAAVPEPQADSPGEPEPANSPAEHTGAGSASIGSVALNPLNKRPAGEDDEIEEMAETIRQHNVIQPLVVCSVQAFLAEFPDQKAAFGPDVKWVVLIGNRRLLAALKAGLRVVTIIVNDEQVASMFEVMLIENVHRLAMPPLYEADAMAEAIAKAGISQRELARRIGKSHMYVGQRLALRKLIPELRRAFEDGELKIERAREFGELPVPEQEAIVAAGKPYRRGGNAVSTPTRRSIRASTPAAAAKSIREQFTPDELTELIRLLTQDVDTDLTESVAS